MYDYFVFQSVFRPFHDLLLFHLLFSLFSPFLFSSLLFSLFSFLSLSSFSSLSLSIFLCLCLRVLVVCVSSCVCVVLCSVVCAVCRDTLKTPCVDSKRPRVCRQHAHMLFSMWAWCRYTRGRFESTHGKRFESTHGGHRQLCLPKFAHEGLSLGPTGSSKVITGCCPCSSLRIDREQHVPDSSHHTRFT